MKYPCPECAGPMAVTDSRPTRYNSHYSVRRRRRCTHCRFSITTYEVTEVVAAPIELDRISLTARHAMLALQDLVAAIEQPLPWVAPRVVEMARVGEAV